MVRLLISAWHCLEDSREWRTGGRSYTYSRSWLLACCKVCPVVGDNAVEFEVTHDVLPKKLDNLLTSDFGECHRFDPFSEVVGSY